LTIASQLQATGLESITDQVNKTTGLLITLIEILKEENGSSLIGEAADALKRLVGMMKSFVKPNENKIDLRLL